MMTCRMGFTILIAAAIGLTLVRGVAAADLIAGEALADDQCGSCHVAPGEPVGLGQAPELVEVVHVVDWNHMRLREWFATGHPERLSFQVTDKDLHDLRYYLMDLHDKSMLGTLGGD